ncbi:hypothetical protein A1QO_18080 [Vibrio genomosp. F10 str. ZF-129]|uniref:Uncharacterized protein n=1 Tax=Vibrio genomosp. F10 str. ZF-129 TaxID=1187848 RepID=A0A1E5BIA3_9VIBR|nr:hypothetical protein [Vibrio genomosp. F10]OEE37080.1 hypothetical protein A1QO_18080 [Vibrio genomosp. F10 str. ZF-129]
MDTINPTDLFLSVLPSILGVAVFIIFMEFIKIKVERKIKEKRGETTNERISRLSKSLKESIDLTNEIESEIKQRHELASKLQADVERFEHLAKLKESEIEAVAQTLRGELKSEGTKSFWKSILVSMFFFIAGVVVTILAA